MIPKNVQMPNPNPEYKPPGTPAGGRGGNLMNNDRLRPDVLACIRIAEYRGRHNLSLPAKIFVSRAAFVELAETEGSGLISRASGGHKLGGVPVVVFDSDDPLEIYLSEEEERGGD